MPQTVRIVLTSPTEVPDNLARLAAEQLTDARDERSETRSWGPVTSITGELDDLVRTRSVMRGAAHRQGVDVAVVAEPLASRPPRLLVMDVDSTFITAEVLDEVAFRAGSGEKVAAITERAMRGELDFAASLRERVTTLTGADAAVLDEVRGAIEFTPGALDLVTAVKDCGCTVALVSGGFHEVVEPLVEGLGIDHVLANRFEVREGRFTGLTRGPVVDRAAKRDELLALAQRVGCSPEEAVAIGDGANDLAMLEAAGLGVAYRAKPVVASQADATIGFPRLDAVSAYLRLH